jgi:hypothetical protein
LLIVEEWAKEGIYVWWCGLCCLLAKVARDPHLIRNKNPTEAEKDSLEPHPSLVQELNMLLPVRSAIPIDLALTEGEDQEVEFILMSKEEVEDIPEDDEDSDRDNLGILEESSDDDEVASMVSNDSITRNADFISLGC